MSSLCRRIGHKIGRLENLVKLSISKSNRERRWWGCMEFSFILQIGPICTRSKSRFGADDWTESGLKFDQCNSMKTQKLVAFGVVLHPTSYFAYAIVAFCYK